MTRIGSLCSGYGGLDLGLMDVIGGTVAWHVENDKNPSAVLAARFPGVPNYGDVTTADWSRVDPVDWLTAGYPCQPFSAAGKRLGVTDARHLWPHIAAAIRAIRPRFILLENVRGHLSRGFSDVHGSLAELGYDTRWTCVRASDAGNATRRERVFIAAADTSRDGWNQGGTEPTGQLGRLDAAERGSSPADAGCARLGEQPGGASPQEAGPDTGHELADHRESRAAALWGPYLPAIRRWEAVTGRPAPSPTEPRRVGERLSPRFVEWLMGLPAGWVTDIDIPRNAQFTALGNGVVPQQAALAVRTLLSITEEAA